MEYFKVIGCIIGVAITMIFIVVMNNKTITENPYSIYDVSTDAIYLAGYSCTINTTPDRAMNEIKADMSECLEVHKQWTDLKNREQSTRETED